MNLEYRVERLEKDCMEMKTDIKLILVNHLPHIENDIVKLSTMLKIYGTLIMAGVTALIILGLTP